MKAAAFDIEVARAFEGDWRAAAPLGISCAALALGDPPEVRVWQGIPQLTGAECQSLVRELEAVVDDGYTLVTWNGCAFDFAVLAQESGMAAECAELAVHHVDLMLIVTFSRGHYLGLQRALDGAGLAGKLKSVTLSDGSRLEQMGGGHAPRLWAAGEFAAVLAYLNEDVTQLLRLLAHVEQNKVIRWTSGRGERRSLAVPRLLRVHECFQLPPPDTSWMNKPPPPRGQFVDWMPPGLTSVLRERPDEYATTGSYWKMLRDAVSRLLHGFD